MMADENGVVRFANAILHGDEVHRSWLIEAANCWVEGRPMPAPRSARPAPKADSALVGELGDGDEEKREIWKQEGYGHNALFNDFACPGEVGFDQGWLACKRKAAALSDRDVVLEEAAKVVEERALEWRAAIANLERLPDVSYQWADGAKCEAEVAVRNIRALKGGVDE